MSEVVSVDLGEYKALVGKLKAADKKLAARMRKTLRQSVEPMAKEAMEAGSDEMPAAGGLAAKLRASKPAVSLGASSATVRLKVKGIDLAGMNAGKLRHPVFGNTKKWVAQDVPAEAFSRALEEKADQVREAFADAMRDVAKELL